MAKAGYPGLKVFIRVGIEIDVTQQFRHRQFPAGNPLANVLVVVIGAIVIAVSLVLGIVAFIALASAVVVAAAIIGVRLWWFNRKLGRRRKNHVNQYRGTGADRDVIEGEFHEVGPENDQDSSD